METKASMQASHCHSSSGGGGGDHGGRFLKSKTTNKTKKPSQSPFMQSLQRRLLLRQRQEQEQTRVLPTPTGQNAAHNQLKKTEEITYSHVRITALSLHETDYDTMSGGDNVTVKDTVNDTVNDGYNNDNNYDDTRVHPLPIVLGRKNMATWWWKACVNARYDCGPPRHKRKLRTLSFCPDRCRPLAQQVHCLSKEMIHISAKGQLSIVAQHNSKWIHIQPQPPAPQNNQQQHNQQQPQNNQQQNNDKDHPAAQSKIISIGLQGETPLMKFRVQILPDTTTSTVSSSLAQGGPGASIMTQKRKSTTATTAPSLPLCKKQKLPNKSSSNNNNNNNNNNHSCQLDQEQSSAGTVLSPRSSTQWIFPPTEAAIQIRRARADARKQSVRRSLPFSSLLENDKSNNDTKKPPQKSLFQQHAALPSPTNCKTENTPHTPLSFQQEEDKDPHTMTTPRRRNDKSSNKYYKPPSLTPMTPTPTPTTEQEQDQSQDCRIATVHNNIGSASTGDAARHHDVHSATKKKDCSITNRQRLAFDHDTMKGSHFEQCHPLDDVLVRHDDKDTRGSIFVCQEDAPNEVVTINKFQTLSTLSDQSPDTIDQCRSKTSDEYSSALQIGGQLGDGNTTLFQSQPPEMAADVNGFTAATQQESKGEMIHLLLGLKQQQQQQPRILQYCQQDSQSTTNGCCSQNTDSQKPESQLILSQMDGKNAPSAHQVESQHKRGAAFPSISFQTLALATGTQSSNSSINEEVEEDKGQQSQHLPSQAAEGRSDSYDDMSENCFQEQSQQMNSPDGACNSSSSSIFRVGSQPDPVAPMRKIVNTHHPSIAKCASTESGESSEASSILSLPSCDKRLSTQTSLRVLDCELSPRQDSDASNRNNRGKQNQDHQCPLAFWRNLQRNPSSTRSKAVSALINMVVEKNDMNSPTAPFWLPSLLDDM